MAKGPGCGTKAQRFHDKMHPSTPHHLRCAQYNHFNRKLNKAHPHRLPTVRRAGSGVRPVQRRAFPLAYSVLRSHWQTAKHICRKNNDVRATRRQQIEYQNRPAQSRPKWNKLPVTRRSRVHAWTSAKIEQSTLIEPTRCALTCSIVLFSSVSLRTVGGSSGSCDLLKVKALQVSLYWQEPRHRKTKAEHMQNNVHGEIVIVQDVTQLLH